MNMIRMVNQAQAGRPADVMFWISTGRRAAAPARLMGLLCGVVMGFVLAAGVARQSVSAATITVESLSGESSAAQCALRDAIRAANLDQPAGACEAGSGDDMIVLAVTGTLALTSPLPIITTTVSIVGPGPDALSLWRSPAGPPFRLIDITTAAGLTPTVVISGLRMVNGAAGGGNGGAIQARNFARLTVVNVAFEDNTAANGGAIHIRGPLTIAHSVFVNNVAGNAGGAVFADLDTVISASVFISNAALGVGSPSLGGGGAARLNIGPNRVVNSVFARNWIPANAPGGAVLRISSLNDTDIFHCAIVGEDSVTPNSAIYTTSGGGIYSARVRNTIITSHTIALHRSGSISMTEDYNLFYGNITNTLGGSFGGVGSGGNSLSGDPQFISAGQNDFRLMGDSPAINAGLDIGISTDFDSATRPRGARPDIGAFEHGVDLALRRAVWPEVWRPGETVQFTLWFTNAGRHAASGVVITDTLPHGLLHITTSATLPMTVTPGAPYQFHLMNPLAPGESGFIILTGTRAPDLPPGLFTASATIASRNDEINPTDNTDTTAVHIIAGPSLTGTYSVNSPTARAGDTLTFTLIVTNTGMSAAQGITLSASIPAGSDLLGEDTTTTPEGNAVVWSGDLLPGATYTLSFHVLVQSGIGWLFSVASADDGQAIRFDLPIQIAIEPATRVFAPIVRRSDE